MIKVIAYNYVKKDQQATFLAKANQLIEHTQKEKGCMQYSLNKVIGEESTYVFIETWETEDDLKAHLSTKVFKDLCQAFSGALAKKGQIIKLEEIEKHE